MIDEENKFYQEEDDDGDDKNKNRLSVFKIVYKLIIGLIIAMLIMSIQDIFNGEDLFRKLCDGFMVGGVFVIGIALLSLMTYRGEFDGLGFALRSAIFFTRRTYKNYDTYKEEKNEKRESQHPPELLSSFIAGGFLIIISLVFLTLYYTAS